MSSFHDLVRAAGTPESLARFFLEGEASRILGRIATSELTAAMETFARMHLEQNTREALNRALGHLESADQLLRPLSEPSLRRSFTGVDWIQAWHRRIIVLSLIALSHRHLGNVRVTETLNELERLAYARYDLPFWMAVPLFFNPITYARMSWRNARTMRRVQGGRPPLNEDISEHEILAFLRAMGR